MPYPKAAVYNKLVRDLMPQIIEKNGSRAITYEASEKEYKKKLEMKLMEEIEEFLEDDNIEELADILEVVYAICESKGVSREELEKIRKKKANERGGFKKRIILKETKK